VPRLAFGRQSFLNGWATPSGNEDAELMAESEDLDLEGGLALLAKGG